MSVVVGLGLGVVIGCGGDDPVAPRVIPGGGIGDGAIDGRLNVHVIDGRTDAPIAGATVLVGTDEQVTDADGLVVVDGVSGPQTVTVKATGYQPTMWVGANGANVTMPVTASPAPAVGQARLSGTIAGWDTITVPAQHFKAAIVLYSQSDDLGDASNNIATPLNANICVGPTCSWSVESRTGVVSLVAAIIDRDTKGTADETDDTTAIIGWATKADITVEAGVAQTGQVLTLVEAGNLQDLTIDLGAPPAGLPQRVAFVGIERGPDEVVQLPLFLATEQTSLLAPRPAVFGATATYRLTAVAQTTTGGDGAQSILLRRGLTSTTLAAGTWLVPPTGVTATRTTASFQPVAGAVAHQVSWKTATGDTLLEATVFDASTTVDVPALVALPASGALTARAAGLGADFDVTEFSLATDEDKLFGIASEPVAIP